MNTLDELKQLTQKTFTQMERREVIDEMEIIQYRHECGEYTEQALIKALLDFLKRQGVKVERPVNAG